MVSVGESCRAGHVGSGMVLGRKTAWSRKRATDLVDGAKQGRETRRRCGLRADVADFGGGAGRQPVLGWD